MVIPFSLSLTGRQEWRSEGVYLGLASPRVRSVIRLRFEDRWRDLRAHGLRAWPSEGLAVVLRDVASSSQLSRERGHGGTGLRVDPRESDELPESGINGLHARSHQHGRRLHHGGGRHRGWRVPHLHRDGLQEADWLEGEGAGTR